MGNILDLILGFSQLDEPKLDEIYSSSTKINRQGDQLEYFVKDLIAGSLDVTEKDEKNEAHESVFSWLGSRNHPPDMMIRSGVAIEVKKSRSSSSVQLNSSTPHHTISSDGNRIIESVRNCEDWTKKDMVYVVGNTDGNKIEKLWVTYGDCWGDDESTYDKLADLISSKISEGVEKLEHGRLDTDDTNEIGKVYEVDPAGRTRLRIRGMWTIDHPEKCFSEYVPNYEQKIEKDSPLFFVIRQSQYNKFSKRKREAVENNPNTKIHRVKLPDPSNSEGSINTIIVESRTT